MSDQTKDDVLQQLNAVEDSSLSYRAVDSAKETLLCRVVDVESSLLSAFKRFVEEEKKSLEDMMNLAREELSKMDLFAPKVTDDTSDELQLETVKQNQ